MFTFPVSLFSGFQACSLALGTGAYASIASGDQTGLQFSDDTDFTLETWIKMTDVSSAINNTLLGLGDISGIAAYHFYFDYTNSELVLEVRTAPLTQTVYTTTGDKAGFSDNTWYHVGVVWEYGGGTSQATFYIGGASVETHVAGGNSALVAGTFVVGYTGNAPRRMDEARAWSTAKDGTHFSNNYNQEIDPATANLVGYWQFNEGNLLDATTNNNDLSPTGAVSYSIDLPF